MNILWSSMLLLGIAYGALQGRMPEVTDGVIQASREAVVLAVSLVGVTGFWAGLMEIAKKAGVIDGLVKRMGPVDAVSVSGSAGRPSCDAGGGG